MDQDQELIELFFARSEHAIRETLARYKGFCMGISMNIVGDPLDAEECVNDAMLKLWSKIPPERPKRFPAFLGRLVRELSLDRYRRNNALKRGGGQTAVALSELEECIPSGQDLEHMAEQNELTELFQAFLRGLKADDRRIFLCRYWYFDSIGEIAARFHYSQSRVKSSLFRTREKLIKYLKEEGYDDKR